MEVFQVRARYSPSACAETLEVLLEDERPEVRIQALRVAQDHNITGLADLLGRRATAAGFYDTPYSERRLVLTQLVLHDARYAQRVALKILHDRSNGTQESRNTTRLIAEERSLRGLGTFVIRYAGVDAPWADGLSHADLPYERPGALFDALRQAGAASICFAGAMRRPWLNPLRFDRKAFALLAKVPPLLLKRDDAMLRGFAALLEAEGFRIVAAHEQLAGLLAPEGVLGAVRPAASDRADAALAAEAAAELGRQDLGQAAVASGGRVIAREGREGTDAMLASLAPTTNARRGVLHKAPTPGQDWRLDLPAIGPQTLRRAAAAGLAGVSIEADGVLVLGLSETVEAADAEGLFLWARPRAAGEDAA